MKDKYAFAFGFLESAVHRALTAGSFGHAQAILRDALKDLEFNHDIELHWPDDTKENKNAPST